MINLNDVYNLLSCHHDVKDFPQEDIYTAAQSGYNWLITKLKEGADNDTLALETAVAMAHYYFFIRTLAEPDKFENYRVGDITVSADPMKALQREKLLCDTAIANAASILTDGGFYCSG